MYNPGQNILEHLRKLGTKTHSVYVQPWSKHLGTLEEIRYKDALC